jgi:hypothetical protein
MQKNPTMPSLIKTKYSQTCIKRSPLGQRKSGLKRGSIHMQFSITGQENYEFLIQVTAWAGLTVVQGIIMTYMFVTYSRQLQQQIFPPK